LSLYRSKLNLMNFFSSAELVTSFISRDIAVNLVNFWYYLPLQIKVKIQ
jgi:hypothetical protein